MIIGYARVSTDSQNLEPQIKQLNDIGIQKIYTDVCSGKLFDRPGLNELLSFIRNNDSICVVHLDRLGRDVHELLSLIKILQSRNISLMTCDGMIDTRSPTGELTFHIIASLAQMERRLISERTKKALSNAKDKGVKLGRPRISEDKTKMIKDLIKLNAPIRKIANQLNISRHTIYNIIKLDNKGD